MSTDDNNVNDGTVDEFNKDDVKHLADTGDNPLIPNDIRSDKVAGDLHTTEMLDPGASASSVISGRYQLLERVGQGGMGEVWLAQQTQPVKRRVAVKLIRPGMGSKAFLARFEQERQALAMMDHPNIAKVYDAGVATNGAPYLVMEFVPGEQLTNYCDKSRLSPKDRLELFVPICQAIQHAHQKGIVHRDLKPANILITMVDGKAVPKIIDFGVAKATGGKLTDQSLATDFGAVVGTLEYMAPEQAGRNNEDVDTRADIYSLGVILYELLTGLRPIDGERLRKAALSEMIRIIREDDPSRPSTRLSTSDSLPSLAAMRQTEPHKLMADLRGELDWVVMKCLEKSRERRYETANGLARDIQRYLAHQPVEARPPSNGYRLKKFIERNRNSVIVFVTCATLLLAGFIGTALGLLEARRQTEIARKQTSLAETALLGETQAREAAETANRQAFKALESFSNNLMEDLLGGKENLTASDRAVLENAQRQWTLFAESKGATKEARIISAEGAKNLSIIQSKLGMNLEAEANARKALNTWESVSLENSDDQEIKQKLAESQNHLGRILRKIGSREEAEKHYRLAVQDFEQLLVKSPESESLRLEYAVSCIGTGNAARDIGKWEESEKFYLMALGTLDNLLAAKSGNLKYRFSHADALWALALLCKRLDKYAESKGHYQKAIEDFQVLIAAVPDDYRHRLELANLQRELGVLLSDNHEDEAGAKLLAESVAALSKVVDEFPSVPRYRMALGRARRDYAQVLGYLRQGEAATEQFLQAIAINSRLTEGEPTNLPYQADQGITYRMFADFLVGQGKLNESLVPFSQAIQILTAAYTQDPKIVLTKKALARSYEHRANTLDELKRYQEALPDRDQVLKLCDESMRTIHQCQRADSLLRSGEIELAMIEVERLAQLENRNPKHWISFAKLYAIASEKLPDKKSQYGDQAVALIKKGIDLGFTDMAGLKADPELDTLKNRSEFSEIVK